MLLKLLNLRPYSWLDILLLGYLARVLAGVTAEEMLFQDFAVCLGLLTLWCFFNISLELVHAYDYRAKMSWLGAITTFVSSGCLAIACNSQALLPLLGSTLCVGAYLLKKKHPFLGFSSWFFRGLIQAQYFLFAYFCYQSHLTFKVYAAFTLVGLMTAARSVLGDLRDRIHNRDAGKKTIATLLNERLTVVLVCTLLLIVALTGGLAFSWTSIVPVSLLIAATLFFKSGYYLHQLSILISSLFSVVLAESLKGSPVFILNAVGLGLVLNFVFYPALSRRSNPSFPITPSIGWVL